MGIYGYPANTIHLRKKALCKGYYTNISNNPLIRPYFPWGGGIEGVPLDFHDSCLFFWDSRFATYATYTMSYWLVVRLVRSFVPSIYGFQDLQRYQIFFMHKLDLLYPPPTQDSSGKMSRFRLGSLSLKKWFMPSLVVRRASRPIVINEVKYNNPYKWPYIK